MSVFSKPPNDGKADPAGSKSAGKPGGPGATKPGPPQPPATPPSPAAPAVVVTRTIEIGPGPRSQPRPTAPSIQIGPPAAPVRPTVPGATPPAAPAQPTKTPTLKMEAKPKSVRPAAPTMADQEGSASIADTFERLLAADVDAGFARFEESPADGPQIQVDTTLSDLSEVRSLFAQLASNHVRQVRDFMIDLRWSDATADWIGICQPALISLRRAADKLDLEELCAALDLFWDALSAAQKAGGRAIEGERRKAILQCYEELAEVMPQAFALDLDRSQREAVILQSLLLQIPEVKKITIDKLYAAGLTTLEAMLLANPGDIAATTGIDEALATRIVSRFRQYREQVKNATPDATRAGEREKVAQLLARLRQEHADYEAAAQGWTRAAEEKKKELRKVRAQTLLDIQVVLARLGEVDRLKDIERLPFERKLAHLEAFLEEARDKYVAQP
jgi:hypothetical protein